MNFFPANTNKINDWRLTCTNLQQNNEFQDLVENYRFDILEDFDHLEEKSSFIRVLEDEMLLNYVQHLRILPDFGQGEDTYSRSYSWHGTDKIEKIMGALTLVEMKCPNIKNIELLYNYSGKNTIEDIHYFDSLVELLKSYKALEEMSFIAVGRERVSEYDSILNRLPAQLTSLNFTLKEHLGSSSSETPFDKEIKTLKEIVPLSNIKTLDLKIDIVDSGFTPKYIPQKFPNVNKLTISGEHTRQELVLAYENGGNEFIDFLSKIPEYDIKSLCIRDSELGLIMKAFEKSQEANVIRYLNLIYSNNHDSDYTTVTVSKEPCSRQPGSGGKSVITYSIHQNVKSMSIVHDLLTALGPHLSKLSISFGKTPDVLYFDMGPVHTTCNMLKGLEILTDNFPLETTDSANSYLPVKVVLSEKTVNTNFGTHLARIQDLDIKYFYVDDNILCQMMKELVGKQSNSKTHCLELTYFSDHSSEFTSVSMRTNSYEKSGINGKRVVTYSLNQNMAHNNTNELLAVIGPYLSELRICFAKDDCIASFDERKCLKHIRATCKNLSSFKIDNTHLSPDKSYCCASSTCLKRISSDNNNSMEPQLSDNMPENESENSLGDIPELYIGYLYIRRDRFDIMKEFVGNHEDDIEHHLNITYSDRYSSDYTSVAIRKVPFSQQIDSGFKRVITHDAYQNIKDMGAANELLVTLGPYLTRLNIDLENTSAHDVSLGNKYLELIRTTCQHLQFLKIRATPLDYNMSAVIREAEQSKLEVPNYITDEIADYLTNVPKFVIEDLHISNTLRNMAKIYQQKKFRQCLRFVFIKDKPKYWNSVKIEKELPDEDSNNIMDRVTYCVSLSKTFCSIMKFLDILGPYIDDLDYIRQSTPEYRQNCEWPSYGLFSEYVRHVWKCIKSLETNDSSPSSDQKSDHGSDHKLLNDGRPFYLNDKGLRLFKTFVKARTQEAKKQKATQCLNLIYCDGENSELNYIHVYKSDSENVITYNVRLDKIAISDITNKVLKVMHVLKEYLTDVNIRFEEDSVRNFSFDEERYLDDLFDKCPSVNNLIIQNFPVTTTSHSKHFTSQKLISRGSKKLDNIADKLAGVNYFEIQQFPFSNTMDELMHKLSDLTKDKFFFRFDDLMSGFAKISDIKLASCLLSNPQSRIEPLSLGLEPSEKTLSEHTSYDSQASSSDTILRKNKHCLNFCFRFFTKQ